MFSHWQGYWEINQETEPRPYPFSGHKWWRNHKGGVGKEQRKQAGVWTGGCSLLSVRTRPWCSSFTVAPALSRKHVSNQSLAMQSLVLPPFPISRSVLCTYFPAQWPGKDGSGSQAGNEEERHFAITYLQHFVSALSIRNFFNIVLTIQRTCF